MLALFFAHSLNCEVKNGRYNSIFEGYGFGGIRKRPVENSNAFNFFRADVLSNRKEI